MADSTSIAGVSVATLALIISIICLVWIMIHIGQKKNWPGSSVYKDWTLFEGGKY